MLIYLGEPYKRGLAILASKSQRFETEQEGGSNSIARWCRPISEPKMKESLHDIWMAETRQNAYKAFGQFETRYAAKYPKAVACLTKDKLEMLAFYDFPAEHWTHIRTSNPIESMSEFDGVTRL